MPRITIVEVTNSAREIEEEMSTLRKNKRSQPLSDNENLDEESMDHEQKKERKNNRKEHDDEY